MTDKFSNYFSLLFVFAYFSILFGLLIIADTGSVVVILPSYISNVLPVTDEVLIFKGFILLLIMASVLFSLIIYFFVFDYFKFFLYPFKLVFLFYVDGWLKHKCVSVLGIKLVSSTVADHITDSITTFFDFGSFFILLCLFLLCFLISGHLHSRFSSLLFTNSHTTTPLLVMNVIRAAAGEPEVCEAENVEEDAEAKKKAESEQPNDKDKKSDDSDAKEKDPEKKDGQKKREHWISKETEAKVLTVGYFVHGAILGWYGAKFIAWLLGWR